MASMRRGLAGALIVTGLLLGPLGACGPEAGPAPEPAEDPAPGASVAAPALYTEITAEVGLESEAPAWPDGTYFSPEIMGPGVALLDYDRDGDLDLLQLRMPPPDDRHAPAPNRLWEQRDDGTFVDVSDASGLADPGYGQGVAVGDADNDGDLDVFVGNYGPDRFYRNDGDGTFTEATREAGLAEDDHWTTAATFCDYDGDGFLDLYVVRYLLFKYDGACIGPAGQEDYCGPPAFQGVPDILYRNDGDGTFTDVTAEVGIGGAEVAREAKGLGVVCTDLTGDDRTDILVANDGEVNHLWVARDGRFSEQGILRGVAVSRDGSPEASMGVAAGDINLDGALDLYITHLHQENNRLYLSGSGGMFQDRTQEAGLAQHDLPFTGFGAAFLDYDHDGDLDLAVVNGRVYRGEPLPGADRGAFWSAYVEPNFLFENKGNGDFENVSARAGRYARELDASRALAVGDLDGDGDLDMVASSIDNTVRIFRNDAPSPGSHWLFVRPMVGSREALGARVTIEAGGQRRTRVLLPSASYQASHDPRVHFGLGDAASVERLEVQWPDASVEVFDAPGVDRELVVRKGEGMS